MSEESAPQQEAQIFEIGDKSYAVGEKVRVIRTSGEVENDWVFAGFNADGGVEVRKEDKDGMLGKSVTKEKFIEWQS